MELVDDTGKPIKISKTREQVLDILKTLKPKDKEQERVLAKMVGERIEKERINKINEKISTGFDGTFKDNVLRRKEGDGFTGKRTMRLIASIPQEMVYVAMQVWGPNVLKDKKLFKEAFVKDETGQYCLTVDPKTI